MVIKLLDFFVFIYLIHSIYARSFRKTEVDYDKIYDVEIKPAFPVKAHTLVNVSISLLENRSLYPGEAFYLNYDNVYVARYEPVAKVHHLLAEYLPFKIRRFLNTRKFVYFELEVTSLDDNMNLEIAVQRRDINYPKITTFHATQMNVYPLQNQLKIKSNVSSTSVLLDEIFKIECDWKDYSAKIAFDAHDFQIIKMEDLEVVIRATLKANKVGENQIAICKSTIDEANDIVVENYFELNVTLPIKPIKPSYAMEMFNITIEWVKLIGALVLLVLVSLVISLDIYKFCSIADPNLMFKESPEKEYLIYK